MDSIREVQKQCYDDSTEWFPGTQESLPFMSLALAGEVGEFCNLVKKVARGSIDLDIEVRGHLIEELTDIFIYTANVANLLLCDLGAMYDVKREFNVERFSPSDAGSNLTVVGGISDSSTDADGEGS